MRQLVYTVGNLSLISHKMQLQSRCGQITLQPQVFAVAERLMRWPGMVVERSALIAAMYADDPDREPDDAEGVLRRRIKDLRALILILTSGEVVLSTAYGVGHSIQKRRR